jgi:hypothetical protein
MDPNLTYSAIFNAPINATLNPTSMDINLTGQIVKDLVNNLKPSIWNSALLFAIFTAIITSTITLYTVKITNKAAEKREHLKRNHDLKIKTYFNLLDRIYSIMAGVHEFNNIKQLHESNPSDQEMLKKFIEKGLEVQRIETLGLNYLTRIGIIGNQELFDKFMNLYLIALKNSQKDFLKSENLEEYKNATNDLTYAIRSDLFRETSLDIGLHTGPLYPRKWWRFWK